MYLESIFQNFENMDFLPSEELNAIMQCFPVKFEVVTYE